MDTVRPGCGGPQTSAELPNYRCHKEVWALKIKRVDEVQAKNPTITELEEILSKKGDVEMLPSGQFPSISGVTLIFEDPYSPIQMNGEWFAKHRPQAGGYFVIYADGYKSYSPAQAFEEGYAKISK